MELFLTRMVIPPGLPLGVFLDIFNRLILFEDNITALYDPLTLWITQSVAELIRSVSEEDALPFL